MLRSLFFLFFLAPAVFVPSPIMARSSRIAPRTDLVYQGAFRLPDERSSHTNWAYGQKGMTYCPAGDPDGADDGYPGSLFSISHDYQGYVSEFSIPRPVISRHKRLSDLNTAKTLQPFTDVTNGRIHDKQVKTQMYLGDIQYFPAMGTRIRERLYWVRYNYYMPPPDIATLGWCNRDFAHLSSRGIWRIGKYPSAATSKYLFEIPKRWADTYVKGQYLAAGQKRINNRGSWGPALYSLAPWSLPSSLKPGQTIPATELLKYSRAHPMIHFSNSDQWQDGAWIVSGKKSALIFVGTKGLRTRKSGREYYGEAGPDGCRSKGYQAEPYYGCILFYDPLEITQVALGKKKAYDPQPYAFMQMETHLFVNSRCKFKTLGGVGYDRERNILYIMELGVDGKYDKKPLVHVWKVIDSGTVLADTRPSPPTNLTISRKPSGGISLTWSSGSPTRENIIYVIYRNHLPIAITTDTRFIDTRYTFFAPPYHYAVEARDPINHASPRQTIVLTVNQTQQQSHK